VNWFLGQLGDDQQDVARVRPTQRLGLTLLQKITSTVFLEMRNPPSSQMDLYISTLLPTATAIASDICALRCLMPTPVRPAESDCSDATCHRAHHDHGKWRSLKEAHVPYTRYRYPLVHMDGSDSCAVPDIERGLSTHMVMVWHRGKAKIIRILGSTVLRARATDESTPPLPYKIVEMIIAHFAHDLRTIKACSLICRS